VSIPLGEEVSQAGGRIRLWVVAENLDEVGHVELIGGEGRLDGPAVSSHPLEEFTNDGRWLRWCLCGCNATAFAKMTHKDPDARDNLAGVVLRCPRAPAARPMPIERRHDTVVDLVDLETLTLEPDSEVRDAVKVQSRDVRVVAGPDELTFIVVE
jgi:hypothetical protein